MTATDTSSPGLLRILLWFFAVYLAMSLGYALVVFVIATAAGNAEAMAAMPRYTMILAQAAGALCGLGTLWLLTRRRGPESFGQAWQPVFRRPSPALFPVLIVVLLTALGSDWYLLEYRNIYAPESVAALTGAGIAARLLTAGLRSVLLAWLVFGIFQRRFAARSAGAALAAVALMVTAVFVLRYTPEAVRQFGDPRQAEVALRFFLIRLGGWLLVALGASAATRETASLGPAALMLFVFQLGDVLLLAAG